MTNAYQYKTRFCNFDSNDCDKNKAPSQLLEEVINENCNNGWRLKQAILLDFSLPTKYMLIFEKEHTFDV